MYHHLPTMRRGGNKKMRFRKILSYELTGTGMIAELEVADVETAEIGKILVSGDVLNSQLYIDALHKDWFSVWEEDIEWVGRD